MWLLCLQHTRADCDTCDGIYPNVLADVKVDNVSLIENADHYYTL